MRRALRLVDAVTACVVAVVVGGVAVAPAGAHSALIASDPAADAVLPTGPTRITLSFNERVSLPADAVRLLDLDGDDVRLRRVRAVDADVVATVPDGLAPGSYVVAWKVVSADSHPVSGAYSFAVGAASGGAARTQAAVAAAGAPDDGVARALGDIAAALAYAGVLLAAGAAAFVVLVTPRAPAAATQRLVRAGLAIGAFGLIAQVVTEAMLLAGSTTPGSSALWDQVTGSAGVQCLVGLVGLGAIVAGRRTGARAVVLAGGAVALAAFTVVGHTRTATPLVLTIVVDVVHLVAAAVWTGGLAALLVQLSGDGEPTDDAGVVARFSTLATVAILAVALAGSVMAWRILDSWGALVHTTYGVLLLVKVGLFAVLAGVGAYNRFVLVGRVGHADAGARPLLRRTLIVEIALVVVIVGVTGALTSTSPNDTTGADAVAAARRRCLAEVAAMQAQPGMESMDHSCPGDPTTTTGVPFDPTDISSAVVSDTFGDGTAVVTLAPARVGSNELEVDLLDATGKPLDTREPPVVEFRLRAKNLGPISATMARVGPGTYKVTQDLAIAGTWEINVSAVTSDFEQPQVVVKMKVAA